MNQPSPLCSKILWILRILLGIGMLWAGVSKLGIPAEMHTMVGMAAHQVGLTFLSTETWFRIATIGEILAWLFLISGCCKLTKWGAGLTVIIMLFALNLIWWTSAMSLMAWAYLIVALVILIWGGGSRTLCMCSACRARRTGSTEMMKDGMSQMKAGAAEIGAGAVASAASMLDTAKDMAGKAKDMGDSLMGKADTLVEKADTLVEKAKDMVDNVGGVVENIAGETGKKAVDTAKQLLDKADDMIDSAKEVVDTAEDKLDDMTKKDA